MVMLLGFFSDFAQWFCFRLDFWSGQIIRSALKSACKACAVRGIKPGKHQRLVSGTECRHTFLLGFSWSLDTPGQCCVYVKSSKANC